MTEKNNLHIVVGLGMTGLSVVRYLKTQGIPCVIADSRDHPPQLAQLQKEHPDIRVILGAFDSLLFKQTGTIVLSPGVSPFEPIIQEQRQKGLSVIGDIELFARANQLPCIAITGTNAKSTVTTLVGLMAKACGYQVAVGGNLGVPALDLLLASQVDLFILELSSFQLETTYSLHSKIATILNITPDHLDRHKTLAAYCHAKQRIYQNCELAVCNADDPLTEVVCDSEKASPRRLYFTAKSPKEGEFGLLEINGKTYLAFGDRGLLSVEALPILGEHYYMNALSALSIGYGLKLPFEPMLQVLREFKGLSHRSQFVRTYRNVHWYNDSKGTNVGATEAAIAGLGASLFNGKLVLIAGGVGKGADFSTLIPVVKRYVRHIILMGEAAEEIASIMHHVVSCSWVDSMEQAVEMASQVAKPHDGVLLSPACASLDMFKNFEHRGNVFCECVRAL